MTKRILIAVSGLSPQILTETVYALAVASEQKWVPDEIHLITTLRGKEHAALNLLSGKGWFHRLREDYGLPPIAFDAVKHIHLITGADGQPLEDIRTPEDNEAAADRITECIREHTLDSGQGHEAKTEVHVSIAGGRKTMGYYAGYALSLFGRDQDRLSHVLVSSPYESHREFYYPTPYEHVIHTDGPDRRTVDCRDARVWLADIPFVRLRDGVPAPLLRREVSFSKTVASVMRPSAERLVFNWEDRTVVFGNERVALSEAQFGLYAWIVRRRKTGEPPIQFCKGDDVGLSSDALLEELRRMDHHLEGRLAGVARAVKDGITRGGFATSRTRLHKKIEAELGKRAARPYLIGCARAARGLSEYAVRLAPECIDMGDGS